MFRRKLDLLLLTTGLVMTAGVLLADDAKMVTPVATAAVAPKAAKADSPTVAAMKAANALADAGKTDEAVAAYEKMGVLKSKKMEAWRLNNEGLAYLTSAKPDPAKAVPLFEKATETDKTNYVAWNNLGSAYEATNELEKAKDAYQSSIDAAKEANASSAKAEGNLDALKPRLEKLDANKSDDKPDAAKATPGADKK